MDELADLVAALSRFEERARKPKKRKKVKTTGRPAKTGPSAGCGTGSGGFKAGNNCAKEDGIPQRPLSQGGALKGANAKDDFARAKALKEKAAAKKAKSEAAAKAKSVATKTQREKARVDRKRAAEKQAKIDELRRAAAERKAQKGERDDAERKAAQEAADKKRSEMLQKIRITKANKKLEVVEAPQPARQKLPGESSVDSAVRENKKEFDSLHKSLDEVEARYETRLEGPRSAIKAMSDNRDWLNDQARQKRLEAQEYSGAAKETLLQEAQQHANEAIKYNKDINDAHDIARRLESQRQREAHGVVSEFVSKNGGGLATANPKNQISIDVKSSKRRDSFRENVGDAYNFLNSSLSRVHQAALSAVKVRLVKKSGADYDHLTKSARHGTSGKHAEYHTSKAVVVHEVAHGLHYGDGSAAGNRAIAAIKDDYDTRVAELLSQNPTLRKVQYSSQRSRYLGYKVPGKTGSNLGYCSDYCDFENGNATGATEVVTMGVQRLYEDPVSFRKKHRRHYNLTLAFLSGMLHR
jgi:hypothetical protein